MERIKTISNHLLLSNDNERNKFIRLNETNNQTNEISQKKEINFDDFPYKIDIQTRWMDNDMYGHVNNVVYYSFFDTTVNKFLSERAGANPTSDDVYGVVVYNNCNYHHSISFPQLITAGLRIRKIGKTSITYEIAIFSKNNNKNNITKEDELLAENKCVAIGQFVHVFVDRISLRPQPIPLSFLPSFHSVYFNN